MPRGNQLTSQWRLLQLVDRPAGVVVDAAARELDCTARTIWRDLQVLQAAGFPIYDERMADGRRSVWRVEDGFKRRLPLKLSPCARTSPGFGASCGWVERVIPLGLDLVWPKIDRLHLRKGDLHTGSVSLHDETGFDT